MMRAVAAIVENLCDVADSVLSPVSPDHPERKLSEEPRSGSTLFLSCRRATGNCRVRRPSSEVSGPLMATAPV
jgi:hypothetical protein